jgi:hypothetical protein
MKRGSLILLVAFLGCEPHFESGKTLCSDKGECPGGFVCRNNYCFDNHSATSSPSTKGDACNILGASACPRILACDSASYSAVSQCVQDFVSSCCGTTCGVSVTVDASTFQQCNAALANMSCTEVTSLTVDLTPPSGCTSYASYSPY